MLKLHRQGLLPLPDSTPVDPDSELAGYTSELRGTLTWAPPRPQIILTVQQQPGRRTVGLSAQRWHCSGCGMKVGIIMKTIKQSFRHKSYYSHVLV